MKKLLRLIALSISFTALAMTMVSCGNESGSTSGTSTAKETEKETEGTASEASPAGKIETWGNLTVFVPEGFSLTGGSLLSKEDQNSLWIQLDANKSIYYLISIVAEDVAKNGVETTKEMNAEYDPVDVKFTTGSIEWTGVSYVYSGSTDCFYIYSNIDGKTVIVQAGWNTYDSEQTKTILASIVPA